MGYALLITMLSLSVAIWIGEAVWDFVVMRKYKNDRALMKEKLYTIRRISFMSMLIMIITLLVIYLISIR